jgi:hypothetical protein
MVWQSPWKSVHLAFPKSETHSFPISHQKLEPLRRIVTYIHGRECWSESGFSFHSPWISSWVLFSCVLLALFIKQFASVKKSTPFKTKYLGQVPPKLETVLSNWQAGKESETNCARAAELFQLSLQSYTCLRSEDRQLECGTPIFRQIARCFIGQKVDALKSSNVYGRMETKYLAKLDMTVETITRMKYEFESGLASGKK